MDITAVTSKSQITIPKHIRQRLGICKGSKVGFTLVEDHVELRVSSSPAELPESGFALLKSQHKAVAADFDPASL